MTKQAQVIEAYKARKAADRYLMDLKVEVESIESALATATREEEKAEARSAKPPAVQHISLGQLQLPRLAAQVSLPSQEAQSFSQGLQKVLLALDHAHNIGQEIDKRFLTNAAVLPQSKA